MLGYKAAATALRSYGVGCPSESNLAYNLVTAPPLLTYAPPTYTPEFPVYSSKLPSPEVHSYTPEVYRSEVLPKTPCVTSTTITVTIPCPSNTDYSSASPVPPLGASGAPSSVPCSTGYSVLPVSNRVPSSNGVNYDRTFPLTYTNAASNLNAAGFVAGVAGVGALFLECILYQ